MSFNVEAEAYDRFMGRYSRGLAAQLADLAGVGPGQRVLDVGCGPGALTAELVRRIGADRVAAIDPSEPFVAAIRTRHPGVDVRQATAEQIPFSEDSFDAALAQLVVHFMSDPVGGIREMARVTRPGGVVAACVWDLAGDRSPISAFWRAVREVSPLAPDESKRPGARAGHLEELFAAAGLREVVGTELSISVEHSGFDEWWDPFMLVVGPAGACAQSLTPDQIADVRERSRGLLSRQPLTISAVAWAARGLV